MAAKKKTAARKKAPTKKRAAKKRRAAPKKPSLDGKVSALAARQSVLEKKVGALDSRTTQFGFQISRLMHKTGTSKKFANRKSSLKKLMGGPLAANNDYSDLSSLAGDVGYGH